MQYVGVPWKCQNPSLHCEPARICDYTQPYLGLCIYEFTKSPMHIGPPWIFLVPSLHALPSKDQAIITLINVLCGKKIIVNVLITCRCLQNDHSPLYKITEDLKNRHNYCNSLKSSSIYTNQV